MRIVKSSEEQYAIAVDFTDRLPTGTTLSSGTASAIALLDGSVATSTVLQSATATIVSSQAQLGLKAWPLSKLYEITLIVTLSNGDKLKEQIRVGEEDRPYPARVDAYLIRQYIETDLADEAIQRLINAAVIDVERIAGPVDVTTGRFIEDVDMHPVSLSMLPGHAAAKIFLKHKAAAIHEVSEGGSLADLDVVASTGYVLMPGGWMVHRHSGHWGRFVRVQYTPAITVALREATIIDLVKLSLQYQGINTESSGDYNASYPAYMAEHDKLLKRLVPTGRWLT